MGVVTEIPASAPKMAAPSTPRTALNHQKPVSNGPLPWNTVNILFGPDLTSPGSTEMDPPETEKSIPVPEIPVILTTAAPPMVTTASPPKTEVTSGPLLEKLPLYIPTQPQVSTISEPVWSSTTISPKTAEPRVDISVKERFPSPESTSGSLAPMMPVGPTEVITPAPKLEQNLTTPMREDLTEKPQEILDFPVPPESTTMAPSEAEPTQMLGTVSPSVRIYFH